MEKAGELEALSGTQRWLSNTLSCRSLFWKLEEAEKKRRRLFQVEEMEWKCSLELGSGICSRSLKLALSLTLSIRSLSTLSLLELKEERRVLTGEGWLLARLLISNSAAATAAEETARRPAPDLVLRQRRGGELL